MILARWGLDPVSRHGLTILAFQDLVVGDDWESPARTITEADVVIFAGLTGDFNPLHMDHLASRTGPFGRPVAHGLLGLALATGLASQAPRVDTLAFLTILEWKFLVPLTFGDTIHALTTVETVEPRAGGRRAVVTWHRRLFNQESQKIQEGRTQSLVRGHSRTTSPPQPQTKHLGPTATPPPEQR